MTVYEHTREGTSFKPSKKKLHQKQTVLVKECEKTNKKKKKKKKKKQKKKNNWSRKSATDTKITSQIKGERAVDKTKCT